jgi:hypothetical protein
MSAQPIPTPAWQWSADVLDLAAKEKVTQYLDPLLQATRELFPKASSIRVLMELDPELHDDRHIVFEVRVSPRDVPHYVPAVRFWTDELYRVCPAPLVCTFRLALLRIDP